MVKYSNGTEREDAKGPNINGEKTRRNGARCYKTEIETVSANKTAVNNHPGRTLACKKQQTTRENRVERAERVLNTNTHN